MDGFAVHEDLLRLARMLGKIRSRARVSKTERLCSVRLWVY